MAFLPLDSPGSSRVPLPLLPRRRRRGGGAQSAKGLLNCKEKISICLIYIRIHYGKCFACCLLFAVVRWLVVLLVAPGALVFPPGVG